MPDERMALRQDDDDLLDDVAVRRVSKFRAETLDSDHLWLCCYLPGTGVDSDRVAFDVRVRAGKIAFELVELPEGPVSAEPSPP